MGDAPAQAIRYVNSGVIGFRRRRGELSQASHASGPRSRQVRL